MLARGALGNPWLFEQVLGAREGEPSRAEIARGAGLGDRARRRAPRRGAAARYLRKFYPWYVTRLGEGKALQDRMQRTQTIAEARAAFGIAAPLAAAAAAA